MQRRTSLHRRRLGFFRSGVDGYSDGVSSYTPTHWRRHHLLLLLFLIALFRYSFFLSLSREPSAIIPIPCCYWPWHFYFFLSFFLVAFPLCSCTGWGRVISFTRASLSYGHSFIKKQPILIPYSSWALREAKPSWEHIERHHCAARMGKWCPFSPSPPRASLRLMALSFFQCRTELTLTSVQR